jgi:hypothetical protein
MSTTSSTLLPTAAAIVFGLGSTLPALAEYDYGLYGGPHQSWCDVNPDCNGWNKRLPGPAYQSNASGVVTPLNPKHRPVHKRGHDADDR